MKRFVKVYGRVLGLLRPHRRAAAGLCAANLALAAIGFIEPVLFGRVIQGLGGTGPQSGDLVAWAALGIVGIGAGMATSLVAPPVVELGRLAGWSPLPLSVRDARRAAAGYRRPGD